MRLPIRQDFEYRLSRFKPPIPALDNDISAEQTRRVGKAICIVHLFDLLAGNIFVGMLPGYAEVNQRTKTEEVIPEN